MKLLIPLSYLNEECNLSQNISEKEFKMHLKEAQEVLRDVLGAEFFEEIETQYNPSGDTLSTDNSALYETYLKPFLAWRTYFESLGFSQSKSTPTGHRAHNDVTSTLITDIQMVTKEKNVMARVNRRKFAIINFLTLEQSKDSTKYPKWSAPCLEEFSFSISAIDKNSKEDKAISINKAITRNE